MHLISCIILTICYLALKQCRYYLSLAFHSAQFPCSEGWQGYLPTNFEFEAISQTDSHLLQTGRFSLVLCPLVLSTTGGLSCEATTFYERLADLISSKQQKH